MPLGNVNKAEVIKFTENQIIFRFGIPETVIADQCTMFTGDQVVAFAQEYGIKMRYSTPYYARPMDRPWPPTRSSSSSTRRT